MLQGGPIIHLEAKLETLERKKEILDWWARLQERWRELCDPTLPTIAFFDANASVGSYTSVHVGDHAPEEVDEAGEGLMSFLEETGSFLPATFSDIAQGPTGTWGRPSLPGEPLCG